MKSHRDRKINRSPLFGVIGLVVVIVALVLFVPKIRHSVSGALASVASKIWHKEIPAHVEATAEMLAMSKHAMIARIHSLEESVTKASVAFTERDALRAENIELKKLLGRAGERHEILARITSRPPHSLYDTLMIDIGLDHNLALGNKVYYENVILGEVREVFPHSAKVVLYSSGGEGIDATPAGHGTALHLTGRGGGSFEVSVPRDLEVAVDTVFTDQDIALSPVAVIKKIIFDPRDPFQTVYLVSPVNVGDISFVTVAL